MALKVVDLHIFGRHLKLNCPENEVEALNHSATDLEMRLGHVREKSHVLSSDQIMITTALNLSYELQQEREALKKLKEVYSEQLATLTKKLESTLNNSKLRNYSQK